MSNYEHPESIGERPAADIAQIERQMKIIISRFSSGFKGSALDIGCSIAYGLSLLQENGWIVLGLDPSEKCIEISRDKYKVRVLQGFFSIELLKKEKKFDVIILSHVVEHLVYPEEIIKNLAELLTDDGIVYIEVPNLMRPNNTKCYFGFEHVNFFTPQSLTNLANKNGFSVDYIETFENGKNIHPYYPVIALTLKKTKLNLTNIINDKAAATKVIEDYSNTVHELLTKLNERIDSIISVIPQGRLALWGAGIHTSQLLSETKLKNAKIHCIFDNDPKKTGHDISGIPIEILPKNVAEMSKNVDAILISSEASEDEIYQQIKFLSDNGIRIYRLYSIEM